MATLEDLRKPAGTKSHKETTKLNMNNKSTPMIVDPVDFEGCFHTTPAGTLSQLAFSPFKLRTLAASLDQQCSFEAIRTYVQTYDASTLHNEILNRTDGRLIITHVIQRNDADMLRFFLEHEETQSSAVDFGDVPVLAFAIMRSSLSNENTTEVVKTLLAFGADPNVIPKQLWKDYIYTPAEVALTTELDGTPLTTWCTGKKRRLLSKSLNLTMRYSLWRAAHIEPVKKRTMQIAKANHIQPLLRVPYAIIGQEIATKLVVDQIFGHVTMQKQKPLVLAFAGLSGHGKTELASQLGDLLSSHFIDIECAQTSTLFSLLGPTTGYQDNHLGSPLNNFLAASGNQRTVVFLDEYDKAQPEVRQALLKVMDNGMYRERIGNTDVDYSKVVWILATNKGDTAISKFHAKHIARRKDEDIHKISIEALHQELRELFITLYSPAVAGRINAIIPFFPFSPGEQAVVAHKFILQLHDAVRKDIDLKEPVLRFVGRCLLSVQDDGNVCQHLAKQGYVKELGARSLETKVDEVSQAFQRIYVERDELVDEKMNLEPLQKFVVQLNRVEEGVEEVSVLEDREK